jgi:predicted small lipoprotein YifL
MKTGTGMTMVRMFAVAVVCVLAAGCGRKGALEAPPDATAPPPTKTISPQSPDSKPTVNVPPQDNTP